MPLSPKTEPVILATAVLTLRELDEVVPAPSTPEQILRFGLQAIATSPTGLHLDPENVCYGEKRRFGDYAARILRAAEDAGVDQSLEEGAEAEDRDRPTSLKDRLDKSEWPKYRLDLNTRWGPSQRGSEG